MQAMPTDLAAATLQEEIRRKNRIYDCAADPLWRLAVYEPVHDGWEFTNMGGRSVLDFIGEHGGLNFSTKVVEFCSGLGDTCRYLAEKFDCHVTGVEMNANQIERAREKLRRAEPSLGRRVHFVQADVVSWEPDLPYDLGYAMDSLMLLADMDGVLRKLHESLVPGGSAVLAEMTAGPKISEEARAYAWEEDGIINLLSAGEYRAALADAGFGDIKIEDVTDLAVDCFDKISRATREREQAIVNVAGEAAHSEWVRLAGRYRAYFRERRFEYKRITATRN